MTKQYNGNDLLHFFLLLSNLTDRNGSTKKSKPSGTKLQEFYSLTLVFLGNNFTWDSLQKIRNQFDSYPHLIKTEIFIYDSAEWDIVIDGFM